MYRGSEYYYIPDEDDDVMRRSAVVDDLRKPGLRNCRNASSILAFAGNSADKFGRFENIADIRP
jgi:hypothetical protein